MGILGTSKHQNSPQHEGSIFDLKGPAHESTPIAAPVRVVKCSLESFSAALHEVIKARVFDRRSMSNGLQLRLAVSMAEEVSPAEYKTGKSNLQLTDIAANYDVRRIIALEKTAASEIQFPLIVEYLKSLQHSVEELRRFQETGILSAIHTEKMVIYKALGLMATRPEIIELLRSELHHEKSMDFDAAGCALWALVMQQEDFGEEILQDPSLRLYHSNVPKWVHQSHHSKLAKRLISTTDY